jgi:hypothetical protein
MQTDIFLVCFFGRGSAMKRSIKFLFVNPMNNTVGFSMALGTSLGKLENYCLSDFSEENLLLVAIAPVKVWQSSDPFLFYCDYEASKSCSYHCTASGSQPVSRPCCVDLQTSRFRSAQLVECHEHFCD